MRSIALFYSFLGIPQGWLFNRWHQMRLISTKKAGEGQTI